jgi:magnesium transporter
MITTYRLVEGKLEATPHEAGADISRETFEAAVWIDCQSPTLAEDVILRDATGIDIPTRAEMDEIETSSRLYSDGNAAYMTAMLPSATDTQNPVTLPVTFILAPRLLVTVRHHEPRAFLNFALRAQKLPMDGRDAIAVLAGLLDAVIDRIADILETVGKDIDVISKDIFANASTGPTKGRDFQSILKAIGRQGDLLSMLRDSLATHDRLFSFFANVANQRHCDRDTKAAIKTLSRDAASLSDHASYLSQKIVFLLDATLGLISIEQNAIIKIFSVAAVIFLPPTLVASVYGMNFEFMSELNWVYGYPYALGLMVFSAVVPYLFFKRRGWL